MRRLADHELELISGGTDTIVVTGSVYEDSMDDSGGGGSGDSVGGPNMQGPEVYIGEFDYEFNLDADPNPDPDPHETQAQKDAAAAALASLHKDGTVPDPAHPGQTLAQVTLTQNLTIKGNLDGPDLSIAVGPYGAGHSFEGHMQSGDTITGFDKNHNGIPDMLDNLASRGALNIG